MTNHETLAEITGENEPVEVEAAKMLISKMLDDFESGYYKETYEENFDTYLGLYKAQLKWLNSEKD